MLESLDGGVGRTEHVLWQCSALPHVVFCMGMCHQIRHTCSTWHFLKFGSQFKNIIHDNNAQKN
jgi:hypothetical protein